MSRDFIHSIPFPGLAADAVLVIHALFVAFVIGGQVAVMIGWRRGWAWTRNGWFRLSHLALIGYVIVETWLGELCPLTVWEGELRRAAGQSFHDRSFMAHWLSNLLFFDLPWWVFQVVYSLFGVLVVASLIGHPPRWKQDRQR